MKYQIIYADPAWPFKNKNTGGSLKSGASNKYRVSPIEEICKLPVNDIAADDCVLFMWWVGAQPREALKVMESWGFKLKTMTGFTWMKMTVNWKLFFGMGFWTRSGSENCLIAVKGKPKRINAGIRGVIEPNIVIKNTILRHSKKPDVFADKIVELMGDIPRIELYARNQREGWDVFGDEVSSSSVKLK